ncbi:MAG: hypothetical protein ACLVCH_12070 [Roseburia inulinivorans]
MTSILAACGVAIRRVASTEQSKGSRGCGRRGCRKWRLQEGTPKMSISEDIIPDETVTLDVFDQLANYSGEQIGWFGQIMLDKFNVKLNIIPDSDGVYETRMESGNLGDLVIWGNDC